MRTLMVSSDFVWDTVREDARVREYTFDPHIYDRCACSKDESDTYILPWEETWRLLSDPLLDSRTSNRSASLFRKDYRSHPRSFLYVWEDSPPCWSEDFDPWTDFAALSWPQNVPQQIVRTVDTLVSPKASQDLWWCCRHITLTSFTMPTALHPVLVVVRLAEAYRTVERDQDRVISDIDSQSRERHVSSLPSSCCRYRTSDSPT